jgi:hypothetical protein
MNTTCPKCDSPKVKHWKDLSADDKLIFKLLPSRFSPEQRKKHQFCLRCNFEWLANETTV